MDLHDAFRRWLISGHGAALPRDVAVHASACPSCRLAAGAFDALSAVDAAAAPEPQVLEPAHERRHRQLPAWMVPAGASAVLGCLTVAAIVLSGPLDTSRSLAATGASPTATATPATTPGGGVLGSQRSPAASNVPTATARPYTPSPSATPADSPSIGITGPTPTYQGNPLPTTAPPASISATATPTSTDVAIPTPDATATASPTATAVATPAVTPTPAATPSPSPQCSNTLDDDGDGLVDEDDPGCETPDDDDEADPPAP